MDTQLIVTWGIAGLIFLLWFSYSKGKDKGFEKAIQSIESGKEIL